LENIAKIKSPIGIYIKAETPDEIAISILAEVIEKLKS
jgi:xanthine/CO dehydrogenase XdhC/CoxF family maturation factor